MIKTLKVIAGIVGCIILFGAIFGGGGITDTAPKIKGLYVGMPIEQCRATLIETLGGESNTEVTKYVGGIQSGPKGQAFQVGRGLVIASPEGKVNTIAIPGWMVNTMFTCSSMTAEEFAQKFADSYNIPEFKPDTTRSCWSFTFKDGTRVAVSSIDKTVMIDQVESAAAVNKSFN